mmetsp:Transcript_81212/g.156862  ORF Transcript_81212/g.156862 Transcript_81212/m.156862 type:complete len:380 (+) Transcript_81212:42-1181(+)
MAARFQLYLVFWVLHASCNIMVEALDFVCPAVTPAKAEPADVTELHPGHVSVIMAMGDSITAAFASRGPVKDNMPLEFRKFSWSIGQGSAEAMTLPYLIHHFNSSLTGYASANTVPQTPTTGYLEYDNDFMDAALSRARVANLPRELNHLTFQSSRITDFNRRWKVLTILIGANDLGVSDACSTDPGVRERLTEKFAADLDATLELTAARFTRLFVNLVPLFSIASVRRVIENQTGILPCTVETEWLDYCECVAHGQAGSKNVTESQLRRLDMTTALFNKEISRLATKWNHVRPDFAVVAHEMWANQPIPNFDFLSKLDCFHPSSVGHRTMAVNLWNSMLQRSRQSAPLNPTEEPVCPNATSVFYNGPATWEKVAPVII